MIEEIWRPIPIPGHEGIYEASSLGRIRRSPLHIPKKRGRSGCIRKIQARPPAASQRSKSRPLRTRPKVQLVFWPKYRMFEVGKLVALAFLGLPPEGYECNHIDGDPWNNAPGNLEWVTPLENMRHAHRLKLLHLPRGREQSQAKLTEDAVREIRKSSESARILGERYGVSRSAILNVKHRIRWAHVPD